MNGFTFLLQLRANARGKGEVIGDGRPKAWNGGRGLLRPLSMSGRWLVAGTNKSAYVGLLLNVGFSDAVLTEEYTSCEKKGG